jgi:hypothetical protein
MHGNPAEKERFKMTTRKDRTAELAAINLAAAVEAEQTISAEQMIGTRNLTAALEALIDRHSLADVLLDLAFIAAAKADHIRENWQDSVTAKNWDKAARICDKAAAKVTV